MGQTGVIGDGDRGQTGRFPSLQITRKRPLPPRCLPDPLLNPIGSSQGLATLVGQGVSFTNTARRIPYTQQYSLGIQRQIGGAC